MEAYCTEVDRRASGSITSRVDFEADGDAWDGPSAAVGAAA